MLRMRYRKRVDDDVSDVDSIDEPMGQKTSRSAALEMKMLKNSQSKMARQITELKMKKADVEAELRDHRKSHLVVIGERNDFKKSRDQLSDECRKLKKASSIQTQRIEAMSVRTGSLLYTTVSIYLLISAEFIQDGFSSHDLGLLFCCKPGIENFLCNKSHFFALIIS